MLERVSSRTAWLLGGMPNHAARPRAAHPHAGEVDVEQEIGPAAAPRAMASAMRSTAPGAESAWVA